MLLIRTIPSDAKLLISEVVTAAKGDWVELRLYPGDHDTEDISGLYVTMYYGGNERIATEPVTLKTTDDTATPWDDRFAVVHLTSPGIQDETDRTGDTNRDGKRDLYCDNYSASLWNSDCIVAIDKDDEPENGGIIDCLVYSSMDGEPPANLLPYMKAAVRNSAWIAPEGDIQKSALDIGRSGLTSYMSIIRISEDDTDSFRDFAVTCMQTPGRENSLVSGKTRKGFVKLQKETIVRTVESSSDCLMEIGITVRTLCDISYQVYASNGREVYSSSAVKSVSPGMMNLTWRPVHAGKVLPTGLYFCRIRVRDRSSGNNEECIVRLVLHNRCS